MGLTPHTPEKSLLPIIDEGIISFDIHISAIGEVGVTCQTLWQINSNIAMIFSGNIARSFRGTNIISQSYNFICN
jgi:hypothetical protein